LALNQIPHFENIGPQHVLTYNLSGGHNPVAESDENGDRSNVSKSLCRGSQSLIQISLDIVNVLNSNRQSDEFRTNSAGGLLLLGQL